MAPPVQTCDLCMCAALRAPRRRKATGIHDSLRHAHSLITWRLAQRPMRAMSCTAPVTLYDPALSLGKQVPSMPELCAFAIRLCARSVSKGCSCLPLHAHPCSA